MAQRVTVLSSAPSNQSSVPRTAWYKVRKKSCVHACVNTHTDRQRKEERLAKTETQKDAFSK